MPLPRQCRTAAGYPATEKRRPIGPARRWPTRPTRALLVRNLNPERRRSTKAASTAAFDIKSSAYVGQLWHDPRRGSICGGFGGFLRPQEFACRTVPVQSEHVRRRSGFGETRWVSSSISGCVSLPRDGVRDSLAAVVDSRRTPHRDAPRPISMSTNVIRLCTCAGVALRIIGQVKSAAPPAAVRTWLRLPV
jgi:hypothetical protein